MTPTEALKLYAAMTLLDPYAKNRTEEEVITIAKQIAMVLPNAPLDWAIGFVTQSMRTGKNPALAEIAAAWAPEARRRVESVPVPSAPAEIEDNPQQWQAWERTRRAALVAGANPQQAQAVANRQLGAGSTERPAITSGRQADMEGWFVHDDDTTPVHQTAQSAKESVMAQLREWAEKQKREQDDLLGNVEGGEV